MWAVLIVVVMTGCGRIGFDAHGDANANDAIPSCTFGPFTPPTKLPGAVNSTSDDWTPTLSADQLTLYFYSLRPSPGSPDIWWSQRADPTLDFPAATEIVEVSTAARDEFPRPTADELELFLSNDSVGHFNPYVASRPDRESPFGPPVLISELAGNPSIEGLAISRDGLRLVFESNKTGDNSLYSSSRPDRLSPFTPMQPIAELDTSSAERSPGLSADELEIFFASDRPGGLGLLDIWHATRPSLVEPFDAPENVVELNSSGDEYAPSLSPDGTQLYYSYDQSTAGGGNADVWVATRSCI